MQCHICFVCTRSSLHQLRLKLLRSANRILFIWKQKNAFDVRHIILKIPFIVLHPFCALTFYIQK